MPQTSQSQPRRAPCKHEGGSQKSHWRYRYFGVFPNTNVSSEGAAYHGAELPLIFGTTLSAQNSTRQGTKFQAYIQGTWTASAKDPACGLRTYGGGWPAYDPARKSLIRLAYDDSGGANLSFTILCDAGCVNAGLSALESSLFG